MPELYGPFEDEADAQYAACVECGDAVDLYEPHRMFRVDETSGVGEASARTYHFCSDDCFDARKENNRYWVRRAAA